MEGFNFENDPEFKAITDRHKVIYQNALQSMHDDYKKEILEYVQSKLDYPACLLNPRDAQKSIVTRDGYDLIVQFLTEHTRPSSDGEVESTAFYKIFAQWIKENGYATVSKMAVAKFFKKNVIKTEKNNKFYIGFCLVRHRKRTKRFSHLDDDDGSVYEIEPVVATDQDVGELYTFLCLIMSHGYPYAAKHSYMFRNFKDQLATFTNVGLLKEISESESVQIEKGVINGMHLCCFCNSTHNCVNRILTDNQVPRPLGNVCLELAKPVVAFFNHLRKMVREIKTYDLREGFETMHLLMTDIVMGNNKSHSEQKVNLKNVPEAEEEEDDEEEEEDADFIASDNEQVEIYGEEDEEEEEEEEDDDEE